MSLKISNNDVFLLFDVLDYVMRCDKKHRNYCLSRYEGIHDIGRIVFDEILTKEVCEKIMEEGNKCLSDFEIKKDWTESRDESMKTLKEYWENKKRCR